MSIRPLTLSEYIGQSDIKNALAVYLSSSRKTKKQFGHTLIYGHAGLGKTSLASIIANELDYDFVSINGTSFSIKGELLSVLMSCADKQTVVFIDEIHAVKTQLLECLYTIMEDGFIDLTAPGESVRFHFGPITIIGATTEIGSLPKPLLDRFSHKLELNALDDNEKSQLIRTLANKSSILVDDLAVEISVTRLSGIPREIVSFFERCVDHMVFLDKDRIDQDVVLSTFNTLGIDGVGMDKTCRKYLRILGSSNRMGVKSLANALGESVSTIENVVEPKCMSMGFITRSINGRSITDKAKSYLATQM